MDVLVYNPSSTIGSSAATEPSTLVTLLRTILHPFYTVQPINTSALASHSWDKSCALLVLQSTGFTPGSGLPMPPKAGEVLQRYVENGGRILMLGLELSVGARRSVDGQLQLYDPQSRQHIHPAIPAIAPEVRLGNVRLRSGQLIPDVIAPYTPLSGPLTHAQVLAQWEPSSDAPHRDAEQNVAGVELPVGQGHISAWTVNVPADVGQSGSDQLQLLFQNALTTLGLSLPSLPVEPKEETKLPSPSHQPLPQFLLASKPITTQVILSSLRVPVPDTFSVTSSQASPSFVLKDTTDTFGFYFVTPESASHILQHARSTVAPDSENGGGKAPKAIIILPPVTIPSEELTPKFDGQLYFDSLARIREASGLSDVPQGGSYGMGEALLYGEVVTSTQTMLERNQHLLSSLPPPIVSLATHQLAGRGRGSNTWLSPEGCLQFSLLLRVPLASFPASRLVFIQYLFGLAVVNACRDERVLGSNAGSNVKLKWPNDIYIQRGSEKKKVGGILVNTSFSGGKVDVIIGCGLNISTPLPVSSLSLLDSGDQPLRTETVLPVILAKFEALWNTFVQGRGDWAPFEDAYLDAWMHSDQLVTVSSITPPRSVRIVGITLDHGLLRTIPERAAWGGADEGYIDLQPDGNSFDLMAGLIKSKT